MKAVSIFLMTLVMFAQARASESVNADHVVVSLVLPETFGSETTKIGVHFQPEAQWHVYWKNPGDSGAAPKFDWSGTGEMNEPQWPAPTRLPVAHLTNLGYEGDVVYLFDFKPAVGAKLAAQSLKLEWLVCKEECVPGFHTFNFSRPVGEAQSKWDPQSLALVERFEKRVPKSGETSPIRIESAKRENDTVLIELSGNQLSERLEIYPVDGNSFSPAKPTYVPSQQDPNLARFILSLSPGAILPDKSDFVLVAGNEAWEYRDVATSSPEVSAPVETQNLTLLILFSFLGGIILNAMPCVFPVLSIKIFSLMKGDVPQATRAREGLQYTAGVLLTFAALGGAFLALRAAGNAVGWGFQLQSPLLVLALAILFWLMALNFLGAFDFGNSVMNAAGNSKLARKSESSFATGVLAVFVAAPCTGPFMGSALGAAATLPAFSAMTIFIGLGLGLASPFLLFSLSPRAARILPKPGAWMEAFKELLAFPLFATVLWLLWVLGQQVGTPGWQIGALVLLGLSFGIWLSRSKHFALRALALLTAVLVAFFGAKELRSTPMADAASTSKSAWQSFDQALIDEARSKNQNVFVDFTAAWCITCQVNKKVVLDTQTAQATFKANNTLLVRADWTNQDPKITAALTGLGRNSVPVYAFYAADGSSPKILPQILTMSMITDLFNSKTKENSQ